MDKENHPVNECPLTQSINTEVVHSGVSQRSAKPAAWIFEYCMCSLFYPYLLDGALILQTHASFDLVPPESSFFHFICTRKEIMAAMYPAMPHTMHSLVPCLFPTNQPPPHSEITSSLAVRGGRRQKCIGLIISA